MDLLGRVDLLPWSKLHPLPLLLRLYSHAALLDEYPEVWFGSMGTGWGGLLGTFQMSGRQVLMYCGCGQNGLQKMKRQNFFCQHWCWANWIQSLITLVARVSVKYGELFHE